MTCKNCGKELAPGLKFCDACGTKVDDGFAQDNSFGQNNTFASTDAFDQNNGFDQNGEFAQNNFGQDNGFGQEFQTIQPQTPKKKGKKGLFIGLGVGAAVLAIVALFIFNPTLKNFCAKLFLSDTKYYRHVEQSVIEDGAKSVGESIDQLKAQSDAGKNGVMGIPDGTKAEGSVKLDINDDVIRYLSNRSGVDVSFVDNVKMDIDFGAKDGVAGGDVGLTLGGKKIATVKTVVDPDNNTYYMTIPELSSKPIKFDASDFGVSLQTMDTSFIYDVIGALPDGKTVEKIAKRYAKTLLSNIEEAEQSSEKVSAGNVDMKVTALKVTIDDDTVENVLKALLEEAKDDDELWGVIKDVAKALDESDFRSFLQSMTSVGEYYDDYYDDYYYDDYYDYDYEDEYYDYDYDYDYNDDYYYYDEPAEATYAEPAYTFTSTKYEAVASYSDDKVYQDLIDRLRDMLDDNYSDIEDALDGAFKGMPEIEYTIYVNGKGEIVGRVIEVEDVKIEYLVLEKGKNHGISVVVEGDGMELLEITGEGTIKKNIYNGVIELNVAGQAVAELEVENYDTKEGLTGRFVIKPAGMIKNALANALEEIEYETELDFNEFGIDINNVAIAYEWEATKEKDVIKNEKVALELLSGNKSIIKIAVDATAGDAGKISVPSNAISASNSSDLQNWTSEKDLERFVESLPDGITDMMN